MIKKKIALLIFFILAGILYADDYRWDLVNALIQGDFQLIENIIKENVNKMSVPDKRLVMNFALTYSYGDNTVKAVNLLRKYNINPYSYDLYTAINRKQPDDVILLLLQYGVKANGEILLLAMEKQRLNLAKQFINEGIDVNYQYPLSKSYADGMTPLLYASKWNDFEMVKLLVENGAGINARAKDGQTALSISRTNANAQISGYLLEHGAEETGGGVPPEQSGISDILDSQITNLQTGTYRLFGGNTEIKFYGNGVSGNISYTRSGRINNGSYKTEGDNLTITIEGRIFIYTVNSNMSFSGNGELWMKTAN